MKRLISYLIIQTLLFSTLSVSAQEQSDTTTKHLNGLQRWLQKREIIKAEKERKGEMIITPAFGPGYTPELGFSIAGGVLTSFKTKKTDPLLNRSSVPVTVGISTTGAIFVSSKVTTYWLSDKIRINGDLWFKNMPDNYFGIGYDKVRNTHKSDSTTEYKRMWFQINPQIFWQFRKNYFIGGAFDINYTKGKDPSAGVAQDPNYIAYNDKPFNVGLGIHAMIDSRDIPVNAWKGYYLLLQAMAYGHYLGGQNNYQVYNIDGRHYIQLFKPGQTLALQLRGRFAVGDVPYGEMSQLGTPFDLRGYLWGEYRDKSMLFGIAEYRHSFYKKNGERSIHGLIGWVAGGSIASDMEFKRWLPSGGIGYRLEVQPRMAIRLDFGIGLDGNKGFYFNFNEAF